MKAMILAAGGGTRLYPLTFSLPKPMAPVVNRPVMEHIIRHLSKHGFKDIVINLHNFPQAIEDYFKDGSKLGVKITYSHEAKPLGTAGGVKNVEHLFKDTFLVIGGDDLCDVNITSLVEFHKKKGAIATIGLSYEEEVSQYGVVVTDEDGKILEFQEKPKKEEAKSHWVNNGIYIFEPDIFKVIPKGEFYDFGSQVFPKLKEEKAPFYGFRCKGYWKDIGNLVEYRNAQFDALEGKVKLVFPGEEVEKGIWMEKGVEVHPTAKIKPPVLIGKQCRIGRDVYLEGPLVLGKYNVLEEGVSIVKSVLWNYNHFKRKVRLENCLVGSECIIDEEMVFEETVLGSGMKNIFEDYFRRKRM